MSPERKQSKPSVGARRRLIVGLATVAGVGAVEVARPGFWVRMLDNIEGRYTPSSTKQNSEVFDQTKEFMEVSSKNSVGLRANEIKVEPTPPSATDLIPYIPKGNTSGEPRYLSKKPILEIPLPFNIPDGSDIIITRKSTYSDTEIKDRIAVNGLPSNTIVRAPLEGEFSFAQTTSSTGTSSAAILKFKDKEGHFRKLLFHFGVSQSLIDERVSPKKQVFEFSWEQEPVSVKTGESLFILEDKAAPGNWLADQLQMYVLQNSWNERNEPNPDLVVLPLIVKTLDGKAVFIKPQL